jgi:hypothetical protein
MGNRAPPSEIAPISDHQADGPTLPMGKDTIAVVFDLGYVLANRGDFGRPFCLLANTDYVPTPNEMRLRLELTRYQPIAAATIAPLSVANACDRRELPFDGTCRAAI